MIRILKQKQRPVSIKVERIEENVKKLHTSTMPNTSASIEFINNVCSTLIMVNTGHKINNKSSKHRNLPDTLLVQNVTAHSMTKQPTTQSGQ